MRTRARLKEAVRDLAAHQEPAAITMSALAKRAEVNRATIYLHYPDVDALVTDAMEDTLAAVARAAALCPLDAPPRPRPPIRWPSCSRTSPTTPPCTPACSAPTAAPASPPACANASPAS
ncbi:helix-turn-helix domain-containing protein [Nonomuraea salmonea]|uniref:TetR/AcrR family transcriptional regulator n=1 Tax=Nonomuraea salmonea TaxID=46181 RepID=UPI002FEA272B